MVNFATDVSCKRCGAAPEPSQLSPPTPIAGIVLEDGYVLPPPPSMGGAWRDHSTLVMTKDATLPDYCVKCDAPANVFRLKRRLAWHHPALYILIFGALLIYFILAMFLRQRATVYLGLCQKHYQRRRNFLVAGWVGLAFGLLAMGFGFSSDYLAFGLMGAVILFGSVVWMALVVRVVTINKIDDRFVWLSGMDANYLARFPPLSQ